MVWFQVHCNGNTTIPCVPFHTQLWAGQEWATGRYDPCSQRQDLGTVNFYFVQWPLYKLRSWGQSRWDGGDCCHRLIDNQISDYWWLGTVIDYGQLQFLDHSWSLFSLIACCPSFLSEGQYQLGRTYSLTAFAVSFMFTPLSRVYMASFFFLWKSVWFFFSCTILQLTRQLESKGRKRRCPESEYGTPLKCRWKSKIRRTLKLFF